MTLWTPWCADCGQRPVARHGDACPGCIGRLEADVNPIAHNSTPPMEAPMLLRVLRWLSGQEKTA